MLTWGRVTLLLLVAICLQDGQAWTPSAFVSGLPVARRAASAQLSMAIPVVDEWKVDRFGRLKGVVTNHPSIEDGDIIETSSLSDPAAATARAIVKTKSGSKYKLGLPLNAPKNGKTVKAKTAKKPTPVQPPKKKDVVKNSVEEEVKRMAALRQAKIDFGLTGETVGDGKYLLSGKPQRSTSGKSLIYTGYQSDGNGFPTGEALTIKVSPNLEALEREKDNYRKMGFGFNTGKFVKFYEFLKVAGSERAFSSQGALVIEKGDEDLKAFFSKRTGSGLTGRALRDAAAAAAQCLQAMHGAGLVWTDMKAENFVIVENSKGMTFKGIDLESAIPVRGNPVDYSPEACPPEFAKAFLDGDGPYFVLDFSYDIWSFGMLLFELGTGRPYYDGKQPSQITRMLKTPGYEIDVEGVPDSKLKDLIVQCLQYDPKKRPSVAQILLHPYFLTTGFGPFSF